MNIGDKVCSKRIGFPACGIVRTFFTSYSFIEYLRKCFVLDENSFIIWTNTYPDWKEESVVKVSFDEPLKPMRFDEYEIIYNHLTDEERRLYYPTLAKYTSLYYPIQDLELL